MVQTVIAKSYDKQVLTFGKKPGEVTVVIDGLTPERSYEDRSVYFKFEDTYTWLQAEEAIELGQALIAHGTRTFMANMVQHQAIHRWNEFTRYLREGRIAKVHMKVVSESPANYGSGFRCYLLTPIWHAGKAPEFSADFSMEQVMYWSPFAEEYQQQLERYGGADMVVFEGYNREAELEAFKKCCGEDIKNVK